MMIALSLMTAPLWVTETLYPEWRQEFRVDEKIVEEKTEQQDLVIFRNNLYGRVLVLDGVVQITEADEYTYQEMLAHVPLIAHGNPKKVLIIGGGDGGVLREVLRHDSVEQVVQVEIDATVIERTKKYLPMICQNSFDNPRAKVLIQDGVEFVKNTEEKFDVIICDSTDPIGPGKVLFTTEFYGYCKNALTPDGIFVNQNGVPFLQKEEFVETYQNRRPYFKDTGFYLVAVPTYVGGFLALGYGTDRLDYRDLSEEEIERRISKVRGSFKYYNAKVHKASFALPQFMHDAL